MVSLKTKRLVIDLPVEMHKQLKVIAAQYDTNMHIIIHSLIAKFISDKPKAKK